MALLALGWLAPATARAAGCAHGPASAEVGHFDRLHAAGALPPISDADRPGPPRPCSGAFCSRPPIAPSAPVPPSLGRVPQWLCLAEPPVVPDPQSSLRPRDDDRVRPSYAGPSLFHPPRAA